ncbi:DUF4292 domain-containing protein [Balneola sp. MJW-20]|uniref:DUF4292 domain-containing protein n=1 Tax=Gracilimonas aurantiaca TaxID=3234185 RepID=UPI0034661672
MRNILSLGLLILLLASCQSTRTLNTEGYRLSNLSADSLIAEMPNFGMELHGVKGSGRAIVSEPGNNERVIVNFTADPDYSLLTIKNRLGIEAGQVLADKDSILTYNKIDKVAEKFSINNSRFSSMNELASINLLQLLLFKVSADEVRQIYENEQNYRLDLLNGTRIYLDRDELNVWQVRQPEPSAAPYHLIEYESYSEIEGFTLPRRITIISTDKESRVAFLVSSLEINPNTLHFELDIPSDVEIIRL